eukprot:CAMPEP_0197029010 /NCGR_PEP_ID=MMETSP1384-20130603/8558_1 /TAXON_ID=29189 /ORGANISM="Ammonia sp." /LENGTH=453 /DNA_ID=CAMNT_0042458103 /DNA_START=50 /DNA_END=1411 /DNA_ORIENTATION=-
MNSYQRQSNIRKARERDPIVDVFMYNNPNRCYSISVPSSKSWKEFTQKIRDKFQLSPSSPLALYQSSLDRQQDAEIDLSELHQYDTTDTNMAKIKHKYVFCVQEIQQSQDDNTKNKKQGKQTQSDSDSSTASTSEDEDSECKANEDADDQIIDDNERNFGLDLDLFDRFCTAKKRQSSKKNTAKPLYHFHPATQIQSLPFHLKQTWLNLKTHAMTVRHIDAKYSMMQDRDKQFLLRTRRIVWPRNLQHLTDEFEYKLSDISSKWTWCIMILHGGKFAGAVFHGNQMTAHKTLSRYVTRKKQGKRQVNHLSTSGVKAGSAGGYKRAWNEKKLLEEIREILFLWMDALSSQCDKIFIHAPGVYNQQTLYGNNEEQSYLYPQQNGKLNENLSQERLTEIKHKNKNLYRLYKKDERIHHIPISTHGVTLKEVERVHYYLSTCWLKPNTVSTAQSENQ